MQRGQRLPAHVVGDSAFPFRTKHRGIGQSQEMGVFSGNVDGGVRMMQQTTAMKNIKMSQILCALVVMATCVMAQPVGDVAREAATTPPNMLTDELSYEIVDRVEWKAAANAHFDVADSTLQRLTVPAGRPAAFATRAELGQQARTIRFEKHSLRSNDFRVLIQADASGQLTEVDAPPVSTYRGSVDGLPDAYVRAAFYDGKLSAMVTFDDETYAIESIKGAVPEADNDMYVVHRSSDALNSRGGTCGVKDDEEMARRMFEPLPPSAAGTGLEITEIGIDADHSFYLLNGSNVVNTVVDVERVMNGFSSGSTTGVAGPYAILDITFEITTIIVRTNPNDPYTTSNADFLLDDFRDVWRTLPESDIRRDVAHLFTGIPLDPPTIGIASVGTICQSVNGFHYGLSESRFSSNIVSRVALTAHEIGHNYDALHCDGSSTCRIMCSGLGGCAGLSPLTFGTSASNRIINYRNAIGCLEPLPPVQTIPFFDDFPTNSLNSNRWTYVDGVFASTGASNPPSGSRAMNLDATGADLYEDNEARTNFIDLSGVAEGSVSYFTQHIGVESGESLIVDYWSVVGATRRWIELNEIISDGTNQTDFVFHSHTLPADALHGEFRLRFRANVDQTNDDWFVDDLTVSTDVPPTIIIQPQDIDACAGDLVIIEVVADGTAPLTYQWFKDGVPLIGQENAALILNSASLSDSGSYTCQVTNSEGQVLSDPAILTVQDAAGCDDGLFCTGVETCSAGVCVSPGSPCTDPAIAICDEDGDACLPTPRVFLVPAGTSPSMTTPGQDFETVVSGASSFVVEVFLENDSAEITGYTVAAACSSESSEIGSPDITYVPESADVDLGRPDYVFAGLVNFTPIDEGQCDDGISCASFADCPMGNSECIDTDMDTVPDTCSVIPPRTAAVLFNPMDALTFPMARYAGQFEFQVPSNASGEYLIQAICLSGDGCDTDLTVLNDGTENPPLLLADGLRVTVPAGRCCYDGDGSAPLECVETTAFECANTFSGAFAAGQTCSGADPCACETDCDCVVPFESGVTGGSDVCQVQSCGGGGCNELPVRYGNIAEPFTGLVQTDDILCGVAAFGSYCACPNADIAGCIVSGIPILTADILALVGAFGGFDPCGCPTPPSAATEGAITVPAPIRFTGDGPTAEIVLSPDRRSVLPGDAVTIDVHLRNVEGVTGYEVALDAVLDTRVGRQAIATKPVVDTARRSFVFEDGDHYPLIDNELERFGAVAIGHAASVPAGKSAYLGSFVVAIPEDAKGQMLISPRPDGVSLWRSSIEMIPMAEVTPVAVTVFDGR